MNRIPESATQSLASLSQSTGEIWGLGEIASYLGISIGATRRLVSHPKFPHPLANQSRNRRWIKSEVIRDSNKAWLKAPGKKGQAHNETVMRWITSEYSVAVPGLNSGWMDKYLEKWELLK